MAFAPNVVTVLGAPGSGVTSLVSTLGQMLEMYDAVSHKDAVKGRQHRLAAHFRDMMAAQRRAVRAHTLLSNPGLAHARAPPNY